MSLGFAFASFNNKSKLKRQTSDLTLPKMPSRAESLENILIWDADKGGIYEHVSPSISHLNRAFFNSYGLHWMA